MPHQLIWLVFFLPVISFAVISLFVRPFVKAESRIAGYITITALVGSLGLSLWTLFEVMAAIPHELPVPQLSWVVIGTDFQFNVAIMVDALSAVMMVVVSTVSLMVQIYSQGYMHGDPGYHRYYAWMSLFTASMLGLVMSGNLIFTFVFWEMVGLCSYLLIGFWYHRPSAADAAKKAFIVTRLGDFGFMAGLLLLYKTTGTLDIAELHELAIAGALAGSVLTWAAIGIFAGAAGKSAQFPLHVWLPDAMEGPTPVSALIHSATMVSAGVFLVARTFPLFEHSVQALNTVAIIGGFTAIFAASMGLVANDIKRVLAYSTISQLGYMMLGLGAGGIAIGIFHLFTHAFFKALLFLGAGSVNHATGTFDIRLMGGLKKAMPWTYATFLIGSLSLAGIWPLAGFWSKDEILITSLETQPVLFVLAMITVFMTAFYMFRVVYLTFYGEYRGGSPEAHGTHPHESPSVMLFPMVVLATLAVVAGFWNVTGGFGALMGHGETRGFLHGFFHPFTQWLPWLSLILGGLGILLAWAMYCKKVISAERIGDIFRPLYTVFFRKYWFDELYENIIVRMALMRGLFAGFEFFDSRGVDGAVNGVASTAIATGRGLRQANTGQLQFYGLFMGIGAVVIILAVYIFG